MHEHLGRKYMHSGHVHQHGMTLDQYHEEVDYSGQEASFRVRWFQQYHEKDYDPEIIRRGLWYSALAVSVANI